MLTDQARAGISRTVFPDSSESDVNDHDFSFLPKQKLEKIQLHGPNIVFESRISELEAQLTQASIDYKKICEENDVNKRKLANGHSGGGGGGIYADSGTPDIYKKQIENLQR